MTCELLLSFFQINVLQYKFIFFQPNIIPCQNDNLPMINHLVQWTSYLDHCKEGQLEYLRDRPFNLKVGLWFFVLFRIFFLDNTRVRIFIFCQNLTLGYMTKTLNQIIFFFSTKIRIFFSATLGIRIFF